MRNIILTITLAFLGLAAMAQTGIGVPNPNSSAQLHIQASDKGVLIPQVALTDLTDDLSITEGNVNSLLVYNTTTDVIKEMSPGYYYWQDTAWQRLMPKGDIYANVNYDGDNFYYTDTNGDEVLIEINQWIQDSQLIYEVVGADDYIIVTNEVDATNSNLTIFKVDIKAAMPKFFYMPTILFDTSNQGVHTKDLHTEYLNQFTGQNASTFIKNNDAPAEIPHIPTADKLHYYITSFDENVIENVSITDLGIMEYNVINNAGPYSYITVIFVVK